jgi:uncharacterized membrane protein
MIYIEYCLDRLFLFILLGLFCVLVYSLIVLASVTKKKWLCQQFTKIIIIIIFFFLTSFLCNEQANLPHSSVSYARAS